MYVASLMPVSHICSLFSGCEHILINIVNISGCKLLSLHQKDLIFLLCIMCLKKGAFFFLVCRLLTSFQSTCSKNLLWLCLMCSLLGGPVVVSVSLPSLKNTVLFCLAENHFHFFVTLCQMLGENVVPFLILFKSLSFPVSCLLWILNLL